MFDYDMQQVVGARHEGDPSLSTNVHKYMLDHTPVVDGTLTGMLYWDGTAVCKITSDATNTLFFEPILESVMSDQFKGGLVNPNTGEIKIAFGTQIKASLIEVSYEYRIQLHMQNHMQKPSKKYRSIDDV